MIRVLVVDDEQVIREGTARVVAECIPDSDITVCATPSEALAEAGKKAFDIAFLDIEMPGMTWRKRRSSSTFWKIASSKSARRGAIRVNGPLSTNTTIFISRA